MRSSRWDCRRHSHRCDTAKEEDARSYEYNDEDGDEVVREDEEEIIEDGADRIFLEIELEDAGDSGCNFFYQNQKIATSISSPAACSVILPMKIIN
jgi:hypothetical protein